MHVLADLNEVPVAQALACDQIAPARRASLTRKVIAAAEAAGLSLRIRVQARSFDSMCRMVASGLAGAVLPRSAAALNTRALGLVMLRLSGLEVERLLLALRQRSGCRPHGVKEPPGHTAPCRVHPFAA